MSILLKFYAVALVIILGLVVVPLLHFRNIARIFLPDGAG